MKKRWPLDVLKNDGPIVHSNSNTVKQIKNLNLGKERKTSPLLSPPNKHLLQEGSGYPVDRKLQTPPPGADTGVEANRIESPETKPHVHGQVMCNKGAKTVRWGREVFSTNDAGTTGHPHAKTRFNSYTKINSKWI